MIDQIAAFLSTSHQLTLLSFGVLVLACIASGLVLLPRALLCVLAGAAFGLIALPIIVPSSTLGALIAFLAARLFGGRLVQRLLGRRRLLRRISDAVDQEGWRIVALMRLGAPVPGAVTNYLFGLTNIPWWSFTWATFLFCIPQAILFVCLGAAGRAALLDDRTSVLAQALIVLGLITSASIILLVTKRARSAIGDLSDEHPATPAPPASGNTETTA
ncbi:hypothetical protein X566_07405 [Afipia sp. P52-10]|uniref:TVP38/TMEM64 family protein n=1 Tax=Afipia sp. P52-10 TaxID=1429916 RepID=UPI0003DEF677|nr:VTT domain-containing protein [Afipia sp. P52-10]ETR79017.1 hypothetical protein X566_07405 [Afipia sp. P52-10]